MKEWPKDEKPKSSGSGESEENGYVQKKISEIVSGDKVRWHDQWVEIIQITATEKNSFIITVINPETGKDREIKYAQDATLPIFPKGTKI